MYKMYTVRAKSTFVLRSAMHRTITRTNLMQCQHSIVKRSNRGKSTNGCEKTICSLTIERFFSGWVGKREELSKIRRFSQVLVRQPHAKFANLKVIPGGFLSQILEESRSKQGRLALFTNMDNKSDSNKSRPPENPNSGFTDPNGVNTFLLLSFILGALYLLGSNGDPVPEITWNTFHREMLMTGEVEKLDIGHTRDIVYVYLYRGAIVAGKEVRSFGPHYRLQVLNAESFEEKLINAYKDLGISPDEYLPINYRVENELVGAFVSAASSLIIFGALWYMFFYRGKSGGASRSSNLFGDNNPFKDRGKAKATIIEAGRNNDIRLKDVGGMGEAKEEVLEFVDYLKSPNRYKELGAKIPKGALLVGPPGTGKTLLARAIATEAMVPFLSMAGPEFVEMFSGVGSARVRDLFDQAKKRAPCIVYIDELDSIGRSRKTSGLTGGENEQENTLIQLLVEMDGMNSIDGVIMLASTNRADILDKALLRPGRFDRLINIDLPTLAERKDIVKVHLSKLKLQKDINEYVQRLAELTPGYSGADLANICNEAALHAARLNETTVDTKNFDYAVERIIAGMEKKTHAMSSVEREMLAYHEAGHVIVGWMLQHVDPLLKVSIVLRTSAALGYSQYFPSDQKLYTTEQLLDRMCLALGGRVAEGKIFQKITTGAEDDLKKVTDIAYKQIASYGMNARVGNISLPQKKANELGKKPYSDKLSRLIDEEVRSLISKCYKRTESLIERHTEELQKVAQALLKHEVLNYEDIEKIIGERPYPDSRKPETLS
ncbi:paraplegin-like [Dendronephthya gigantea]|uniref:paraplegin-like n=1 Tax=Dendronephthya gigantea TaxID=151771 RepID=UPI00106B75CF|nr:paraplegin-like [Dendronephthya gigantea]XP_028392663.1 paraplegin-like [Dendronephthya gigantea]